jgi:hypothetical protein
MEVWRTSRRPQREPARTGMSRVAGVRLNAKWPPNEPSLGLGRDAREASPVPHCPTISAQFSVFSCSGVLA